MAIKMTMLKSTKVLLKVNDFRVVVPMRRMYAKNIEENLQNFGDYMDMDMILFLFFTAFVHSLGIIMLLSILVKAPWKKNILFFLGLLVLNGLNAFFVPQIVFMSPLIYLFLIPLMLILIYSIPFSKGALIYSLVMSHFFILQSANFWIFYIIFKTIVLQEPIQITILICMTLVECLILKKMNVLFFKSILEPVKKGNLFMLIIRFVPGIFVVWIILISIFFASLKPGYVVAAFSASLCIIFFLILYYYETKVIFANINAETKRKQLEDFSLIAGAIIAQKHEQHNHMQSILLLIEAESDIQVLREETRGYIERFLTHDVNKVNISGATDRKLLESLLYFKNLQAISLGIDFQIIINEPITDTSITDYDLNEILGCLIDNAFEASGEGIVYLILDGGSNENSGRICVKNQHSPLSIEFINHMMEKGVTTKANNVGIRGYGLYNLKSLLEKNRWKFSIYNENISGENFVVTNVEF